MNKRIQRLFLFETFEIQTKLSKTQIIRKLNSFADPEYTDYRGYVLNDEFTFAEKHIKGIPGGTVKNSFAPVAKGKIYEADGISIVKVVVRPRTLVIALFGPIYLMTLVTVVLFPVSWLFVRLGFVRPTQRLKVSLENILLEK